MNLNVLLSQLTNVKSQLDGEWRQENSEFLTNKPTPLLVALMHVPKYPQRVSRVHPQMAPPQGPHRPLDGEILLSRERMFSLDH